jgi:hypothetical protein
VRIGGFREELNISRENGERGVKLDGARVLGGGGEGRTKLQGYIVEGRKR